MGIADLFSFSFNRSSGRISEIFPFDTPESEFVIDDVTYIFQRILIDVLERTDGIPEDQFNLFWDNCVASESTEGLVTLVSKAMTEQKELYLVYRPDLKLVRQANQEERIQIAADYKKQGSSKAGVYITFKNFNKAKFMKIYSALEYTTICALSKNLNLSKAIQIKINELRASVGLNDKAKAESQGETIAEALEEGEDVLLDSKDIIEMLKVDISPTETAMQFINNKRSFYLGLPAEWITGLRAKGLSDTGKADSKAVDRGLRAYYFSIIKPLTQALFDKKTTFKSDDFEEIATANETLKTFEISSEQFISSENKNKILNKLYRLEASAKGDPVKAQETPPAAATVPAGASKVPAAVPNSNKEVSA